MTVRAGQQVLPWVAWVLGGAVVLLGLLSVVLGGRVGAGWLQGFLDLVSLTVFGFVGALIAARLPANPHGWLWLGIGLAYGGQELATVVLAGVGPDPWGLQMLQGALFLTVLVLLVLVLVLFPTGRLPSPVWRWLPRSAVVIAVGSWGAASFLPLEDGATGPWVARESLLDALGRTVDGAIVLLLVLVVAAAGSVFARFRRAGALERLQLKWLVLAAGLNAVLIMQDVVGLDRGGPVSALVDTVSLTAIPVAVGIAVLRYRLYEIDRIVSRTVSYGLLTAGLVGLYLLVVTLLRPLLQPLAGSSSLAVVGSTLVVAAAFNPVRRRLQAAVDRRFDRARYDAARAVDAFAARLREQVDLDEVVDGLRGTVTATVAPTRVAVWLRPGARS